MFKKYSKIVNSYDIEFLDKIKEFVPENEVWCVTEKLHGTNFSILRDGSFARKTDILKDDEKFYGYQKYKEMLVDIAACTFSIFLDAIQIYGEFFGPGIQKGVNYGTEKQFKIFDVRLANSTFVSAYDLHVNLPYKYVVPYLTSGTLEECLKYPNDGLTTLNPVEDNVMEGVVIRPLFNDYYLHDSKRCIIKNKNEKFKEKQRVKKERKPVELSEEDTNILNELAQYVTVGRINNVRSSIGEDKNFNKILGLTVQDILEETGIKVENKLVKKELGKIIAPILRKELFYDT